jgi:dihydrodipicolinate synthase/N-acetylneuraminate lyase/uridine kinase
VKSAADGLFVVLGIFMHKYKTHVTYTGQLGRRDRCEDIVAGLLLGMFSDDGGPVTIAIGGPGGTGKTTFSGKLAALLGDCAIFRLDDYKTPREVRKGQNLFGAHPDANLMSLAAEHISLIKKNTSFDKPVYNAVTGVADETEPFEPRRFNILDGEISTYRDFRDDVDFSIFIDSDYMTQLTTRTSRDIDVRGYTWDKAIATFLQSNLREFTLYGAESKNWADVHVYCKEDYSLAVESVAGELYDHFESLLNESLSAVDLSGLVVPVTTPFDANDEIDKRMFIEHLDMLAKQGVKRILVNGTTAEFFSMTEDERKVCLKLAREYFPGVVMFHAGSSSLKQTMIEAKWGRDYGADAIVCIVPYYMAGVDKQGIVDYFNALAGAVEIPLILYNFPKHSGNAIDAEMLGQIKHFGMKDSSGDLSLVSSTGHYYMGGDEKILAASDKGAYGFVSARANAFAPLLVEMEAALRRADGSAKDVQDKIVKLKEMTAGANGIARLKYAVSQQLDGYPVRVRLPLIELSDSEKAAMDGALGKFER